MKPQEVLPKTTRGFPELVAALQMLILNAVELQIRQDGWDSIAEAGFDVVFYDIAFFDILNLLFALILTSDLERDVVYQKIGDGR